MHIPVADTKSLPILTFAEAMKPSGDTLFDRNKWLYIPDFYSDYRYVLGTRGTKPLICIGINPSTAAPDNLDNTLKSVERIAHGNGFDSYIMFNVYAQRATRPDDMEKELNSTLHEENMKAFAYILSLSEYTPAIWAAWGTIIEKREYLRSCVLDMIAIGKNYGANWLIAGPRSKVKGHPHHPLYLRKDAHLETFDVESYLNNL